MKLTHIPFTKYKFVAWGFSLTVMLLGIYFFIVHGGFNLGIDFLSGVSLQVQIMNQSADMEAIRQTLISNNFGDNISQLGAPTDHLWAIKVPIKGEGGNANQASDRLVSVLKQKYGENNVVVQSTNVISPSVSQDITNKSWLLILGVCGLITLYTLIRFKDIKYSLGAVLSIIHDGLWILAFISITYREMNTQIMAAILTLLGYSLNDSIVVLSKIKENEFQYTVSISDKTILKQISQDKSKSGSFLISDFEGNINNSINITLSRTIITSLTVFIVVLCIWLFGGVPTRDFAFILTIGVVIGTYSSIYIASPILLLFGNPHYTAKK